MSALSGGELGPGPGPRPSTARPGCFQGRGVGYLNPLASESRRWELGLVASVVSWSGTSLWTFILSWWGLFLVEVMDTTRPQNLKDQSSEGLEMERPRACPCDPMGVIPASPVGLWGPAPQPLALLGCSDPLPVLR